MIMECTYYDNLFHNKWYDKRVIFNFYFCGQVGYFEWISDDAKRSWVSYTFRFVGIF